MRRDVVGAMRARVGLTWALFVACGLAAPAAANGQETDLMADIREAAAQRAWIREYLGLYDELLTMQAALGQISGEDANAQVTAAATELHVAGYHEEDLEAVRYLLEPAIEAFLASLEYEVLTSETWPDQDDEIWRSLALRLLGLIRTDLAAAFASGEDPLPLLCESTRILALARGYRALPPELDFFGGTRDRVYAALPLVGVTVGPIAACQPGTGGLPPLASLPGAGGQAVAGGPPAAGGLPAAGGIPAGGGQPVAGGAPAAGGQAVAGGQPVAGGAPGVSGPPPGTGTIPTTRVVLPEGAVEVDVRVVGQGPTDVVGQSPRLRADGRPDTEIALQLYAPRFLIDWIEVKAQQIEGEPEGVTWSTKPDEGQWLLGVANQGQLLNEANGSVSGLGSDAGVIEWSLFLQDDGQLDRSDYPGYVIIHFQEGAVAAFLIAPAGLDDARRARLYGSPRPRDSARDPHLRRVAPAYDRRPVGPTTGGGARSLRPAGRGCRRPSGRRRQGSARSREGFPFRVSAGRPAGRSARRRCSAPGVGSPRRGANHRRGANQRLGDSPRGRRGPARRRSARRRSTGAPTPRASAARTASGSRSRARPGEPPAASGARTSIPTTARSARPPSTPASSRSPGAGP